MVPGGTVPETAAAICVESVSTSASIAVILVESDAECAGNVVSLNLLFEIIEFAWNGDIVVGLLAITLLFQSIDNWFDDEITPPRNIPSNEPLKDPV